MVFAPYRTRCRGPVAVRSSATAEDLAGAAFAGQQDTFLGAHGGVASCLHWPAPVLAQSDFPRFESGPTCAFGSGGASAAGILGLTFLISNGSIQSAVSSWALGSALRIHPLVVPLATLIGGTVAGLIGMVLAPPLLAAIIQSVRVVKERQPAPDEVEPSPG